MGFTTSDLQRNVMGQSTEMSPLVSMLFRTFLNPLKFFVEILHSSVTVVLYRTADSAYFGSLI